MNIYIVITEGQSIARKYFSDINAHNYDTIVKYTTFGRDSAWKKIIAQNIDNYKSLLELACGTGIFSSYISSNKEIKIIGVDLTFDYIIRADHRKKYSFLANCVAESLPFKDKSFDVIISSYLAKYADLPNITKEIWRVLDDEGIVVFHDFIYPRKKYMRIAWKYYFILLKHLGKVVKSWAYVFSDLDKLIKNSRWERDLEHELKKTGFCNIIITFQTGETSAIITAKKPMK